MTTEESLEYVGRLLAEIRRETMEIRTWLGKIDVKLEVVDRKVSEIES